MKNVSVVLLAVFALTFAGLVEAANPKKRSRNANRVGPYAMFLVGQSNYTSDQSQNEQDLLSFLADTDNPMQNLGVQTEDTDIGYNATFGYRFTRYFAAELGLAQFGSVASTASADMDFGDGRGFVPVSLKLDFAAGGPMISAIGIFPVNDKFELFGRLGYLFASTDRELSSRVDGERGMLGGAKGDSQDMVLGAGMSYHFNQVYSARLEYQQLELGEDDDAGAEDLRIIGIGVMVRF